MAKDAVHAMRGHLLDAFLLRPVPLATDSERKRNLRLGVIESTFEPLAIDAAVARELGRLAAGVRTRGGQPRRRALDLAIAATANVHGVPLLTDNTADFRIIGDLVALRAP